MESLKALANGSDIRGIAISTDEHTANLTDTAVTAITVGIINWFDAKKNKQGINRSSIKFAIGHDSRLSAEALKLAMIASAVNEGVQVIDVGLATTPAMFMATQFSDLDADIAIMITASHLPYFYNGIKIFTREGGAEHEDIDYIVENTRSNYSGESGSTTTMNLIPLYSLDLVNKIRKGIQGEVLEPLKGFHIIVDAGNGAGGFFAKGVLEELGADTTGSQFLDPDGHFPNHMPNPDNKEAMASIQNAVLHTKADLGVIFDTDVDRAAVVDKTGEVINRNNLIAVLATIVLEEHPGCTIVTNSPTSSHLKAFINDLGGKQVRYLCGYRNVINKAMELNKKGIPTELAIETSGHAAFKENYFLDDGAYVIAKILMLLPKLKAENRSIGDLIATLKQPIEADEVRFKINTEHYKDYGRNVINELGEFILTVDGFDVDKDNEEGIRANVNGEYGSGWFLLRMSLHEPLLVLQVENDVDGMNDVIFRKLAEFFGQFKELDTSNLAKKINL